MQINAKLFINRCQTFVKSSALLVGSVGFLMSATKCQQQDQGRTLKKNVKLVQLDASSFLDNSGFSFSEVARSQFSGVLFDQNLFYERNIYPTIEDVNGITDDKYFSVKSYTQKTVEQKKAQTQMVTQVKKWFPDLKSQEIALSKDSSCFFSRPQHYLAGKINSLEAYSGAALQFGFSQTIAPVVPPISAKLKLDRMRMDLSFHAIDPWTQQIVSSVNSEAFKNDYSAGFGIDLGLIHIGPEFYRATGMSEVTLKGLTTALSDLGARLLSIPNEEWSTRVILSRDNYVLIMGGAELGIKNGDQFKIFNQVHTWNGAPCAETSILTGSVIVSDAQDPWIVQVEDAGTLMSKARVLNIKENSSIDTGALVKLHQFVQPPPAQKKN